MRNFYIAIIALLLFIVGCNNNKEQPKETDLTQKHIRLKGKVKSVRGVAFKAVDSFGKIIEGRKIKHSDFYNTYNEQGMQEEVMLSSGGKRVYLYDENLNIIDITTYSEDGTIKQKEVRFYDDLSGKIQYSKSYYSYDSSTLIQTYDKYGNHLKWSYIPHKEGEEENPPKHYKYDSKGNWIEYGDIEDFIEREIEYYD